MKIIKILSPLWLTVIVFLITGCPSIDPKNSTFSCKKNSDCLLWEYCYLSEDCDWQKVLGHCQEPPESCSEVEKTVCGCDGIEYKNECTANLAGQPIMNEGDCGEEGGL